MRESDHRTRYVRASRLASKLVRDPLNLLSDHTQLKWVLPVHNGECRRLAPSAIEKLSIGGDPIPVAGFGVLGDLQQAMGKTQG